MEFVDSRGPGSRLSVGVADPSSAVDLGTLPTDVFNVQASALGGLLKIDDRERRGESVDEFCRFARSRNGR